MSAIYNHLFLYKSCPFCVWKSSHCLRIEVPWKHVVLGSSNAPGQIFNTRLQEKWCVVHMHCAQCRRKTEQLWQRSQKESQIAHFLLGKAWPACPTSQLQANFHYIKSHGVLRMAESVLVMREDNVASISKMWFITWPCQSPRSGQSHVAFLITKTQNLLCKMMSHRLPSAISSIKPLSASPLLQWSAHYWCCVSTESPMMPVKHIHTAMSP